MVYVHRCSLNVWCQTEAANVFVSLVVLSSARQGPTCKTLEDPIDMIPGDD